MYDPVLSRNAAEVLAQLFALTRRAPREVAARLDRESAGLSADLLTNLRQFGSTPTPRQLQALKQHLSLTIGGAFKLFGYSLDGMRGVEGRLNGGRTRFIESYPFYRDRPVDLPGVLGHNDAFQSTAFLSDLVVRWQKGIPIRAIRGPHWQKDGFLYAQLGSSDTRSMPKVPPGSYIAIRPIGDQERQNPNPEWMYFLQLGNGYLCCGCAVRQHKLSIITEDRDYAGPHEFLYPGEIRIVGRVTSFGVRLPLAEPSLIQPPRRTFKPAPLILPWEHTSLRNLISAERQRFGIGELCFPPSLGGLPARAEELFVFEAMERGIQGSLLDLKCVARDLLDSLRDGIAVNGSKRNDPHDEKVKRALRKVKAVVCFLHTYDFYIYIARCRRSRYIRRVNARWPALFKTDSEIGPSCDEGQNAH